MLSSYIDWPQKSRMLSSFQGVENHMNKAAKARPFFYIMNKQEALVKPPRSWVEAECEKDMQAESYLTLLTSRHSREEGKLLKQQLYDGKTPWRWMCGMQFKL